MNLSSPPLRKPMLRNYQSAVLVLLYQSLSVHRGRTLTVLFPRQAGKNEVSAALVATILVGHAREGGSIVICAPTYRPQGRISEDRSWQAIRRLATWMPEARNAERQDNEIRVGRARALFLSASEEAHSPGHTASLALIADEAQDINEAWFDRQFRPMAASTGAATVLFGTPWDGRSLLDHAVARNRAADAVPRMPGIPPLHHEVPWEVVAETRPAYGLYVRQERERLGADHPLFLSQYGLRTVESAGRMFSAEQVVRIEGSFARLSGPSAGERYVAGLDLGGDGERADASVLTIARVTAERACEVIQHIAWAGAQYVTVEQEVTALARRWRIERLSVDGTGLGGPVAATLERELGGMLDRVFFTAAVKSALGYGLIAGIDTGRLRVYASDGSEAAVTLRDKLADCRSRYSSGRELRWGNDVGHDDYVVSLALCLRSAESVGAPRVATGRRREQM